MADSTKRYAVVTGANKGIGFAICKELASKGVVVVLTARDQKRGLEAIEKLKDSGSGLPYNVIFHQLDVTDPASIASLQEFVKAQFGKLDILVNNAGVGGSIIDAEALRASGIGKGNVKVDWSKIAIETYELAEECLEINYYGAKRMYIPSGWAKEVLSNVHTLAEDKVVEVLKKYLKDFKEGSLEMNGWPVHVSAYTISKIAMNAYTRILAPKYPSFCVNCVCPGYVKTNINCNTGIMTPEEGARSPVLLALLPKGGPSGRFFSLMTESSFE
ncbi:hypothetical protein CRG98_039625 [Punica granatum]|uniref:(+)-neomenthol dehydrogenase-like n=1 Tax=Punica granatum TaxID=22663 RepID=A0A2I0I7K7_PUNGR|nr:hypothetical protein CRG98_039625 [Punica granatum]